MRLLRRLGALALATAFNALPAQAFIWNEIGDAGETLPTAQFVSGPGPLTQINGHLAFDLNTLRWDVDLYRIQIIDPASFSANTLAGDTKVNDPALFLFDLAGNGVYMNNDVGAGGDCPAGDCQGMLPPGNPNGPTSPGFYYLAIAWGFSDPQDQLAQSIFSLINQLVDPTIVQGPEPGVGPLAAWVPQGPVNFDEPSDYMINLTGVIPEPGTMALLAVAAVAMFARRRRID